MASSRAFFAFGVSVMGDGTPEESFGCEVCCPPAPDVAWEARRVLAQAVGLIDESHLHVMILTCPRCSQRFLSVFTEMIDRADGDDPQHWSLLPITAAEADDLVGPRESLTETRLNALGPGRRCLQRACPKDAAERIYWGSGFSVGPHD